jgi:hypothetical protein
METFRKLTESLARKTSRRNLFGRGAGVATGALLGAAAGTLTQPIRVSAGGGTVCDFPGPPCNCNQCQTSGVCDKPCIIMTVYYSSGCWVRDGVTCCDCDCNGTGSPARFICGCGADYHQPGGANCVS